MQEDLRWAFGILLSRCIRLDGHQASRSSNISSSSWQQFDYAKAQASALDTSLRNSNGGGSAVLDSDTPLGSLAGQQVLLPFADYLNHDMAADACHLEYDEGAGAVAVALDRAYEAGEQVCEWHALTLPYYQTIILIWDSHTKRPGLS